MKKKPIVQLAVATPIIDKVIRMIRGQKVILDRDLAAIYEVTTGRLNEAVKRNFDRFPPEFLFQLTVKELQELLANCDNLQSLKYAPRLPSVFTEHGALMAATVLNSPRATQMSLFIIRTFTKMRELLISQDELRQKLDAIDNKIAGHDIAIRMLFNDLQSLLSPRKTTSGEIGFHTVLPKLKRKTNKQTLAATLI